MADSAANHFGSVCFIQEFAVSELSPALPAIKKLSETKPGLPPALPDYSRTPAIRAFHSHFCLIYQYSEP